MNIADLHKPFPPERISWRVGSTNSDKSKGLALAYIDARDVMQRLDAVCGPENWECRYPHAGAKTVCEIGIFINDKWVVKADGAGDSDVEAEKGALSDAFKRAAVKWGVGQYLYDLDSPWVKIEPAGRSVKIAADEYPRLRKLLGGDALPEKREPYSDPDGQMKAWIDQEKKFISRCESLEDVQAWEELRKDALHRLKLKNLPAWNDLHQFKETAITELARKAA